MTARPLTLTIAAAVAAVEGGAGSVAGVGFVVAAVVGHPHDRGTAVFLGALLSGFGLGVLLVARGLFGARSWARTPAYLVQFFAGVVAIGQLHTLPGPMVPVLVAAVVGVVTLTARQTRAAFDASPG